MDANRLKVLEMVSEGTITVEDAERLLDRLKTPSREKGGHGSGAGKMSEGKDAASPKAGTATRNPRYFRVVVNSSGGDHVNVRVPMALVRTGVRLSALLPENARVQLENKGVDLGSMKDLKPDEIVSALSDLAVDLDSAEGDLVRVFCE